VRSTSRSPSKPPRAAGTLRGSHGILRAGSDSAPAERPALRQESRISRTSLPTQLERDTLLWPEIIAESVVTEASRYLNAEIPTDFAERLAAKAHYLYPRHRHFHKMLNRAGNRGRDSLYMYMRHWTASWLKRERYALFKRLPWDYALGRKLPSGNHSKTPELHHSIRESVPASQAL
jgi:hypothetical protein